MESKPTLIPMLSWCAADTGYRGFDDDGTSYTRATPDGVTLRVQEAQLSEPFFRAEAPWEEGRIGWAIWPRDRLVGIEAAGDGDVTLKPVAASGEPIRLNYRTASDGWIRAEIITSLPWPPQRGEGAPGYRLEECEPLTGDSLDQTVTWKAGADLAKFAGQTIRLRFRLHKATLFAATL